MRVFVYTFIFKCVDVSNCSRLVGFHHFFFNPPLTRFFVERKALPFSPIIVQTRCESGFIY